MTLPWTTLRPLRRCSSSVRAWQHSGPLWPPPGGGKDLWPPPRGGGCPRPPPSPHYPITNWGGAGWVLPKTPPGGGYPPAFRDPAKGRKNTTFDAYFWPEKNGYWLDTPGLEKKPAPSNFVQASGHPPPPVHRSPFRAAMGLNTMVAPMCLGGEARRPTDRYGAKTRWRTGKTWVWLAIKLRKWNWPGVSLGRLQAGQR